MHRNFDRNLDQALDLKSTPLMPRGLALVIALLLVGLIGWYGLQQKHEQDVAAAAKKAKKQQAVAAGQR